jgi:hypothetical protein
MISIRKHQGGAFLEVLRLLQEMTPPSSSAGTRDDGRKMNECKKGKKKEASGKLQRFFTK